MICAQFIFRPGRYDDEFHRLDNATDEFARSLPGFVDTETWTADGAAIVNAIYYFDDRRSVALLARYPDHREAQDHVHRWYDGYPLEVPHHQRLHAPIASPPSG